MKTQAQEALNKAQALNSSVLQQVMINEVEKLFPGWFEAGGELDITGYAATLSHKYDNANTAKLIEKVDFWKLPANCLSCTTNEYIFSQQKVFVMPQYGDVEIRLNISRVWPLPADDLSTLRALGKVKICAPSYATSYSETVTCELRTLAPF